ncbi:hemerythrin domain-containing protein [Tessaracoccus oleiagri]|uniref:Hemerythrin HHE cation binding domain-containing protein n=1 Tax=Tessaracoccus oleiagri TaxID=686624 RepID=A0A1G9HYM3_9ACTN|nr:hemerythrin domain-containing protein [Tessaracoccus oleiagri]SDL17952.1 Hemerythrin HHE cation binding domain-containing protein [Tessaracoccus oleiagri]
MVDFYSPAPGETAPPVPEGPTLCKADDMRVVHNMFLFVFGEAPGLIRSTADWDARRAELVGAWLADMQSALHAHHTHEDETLWGRLEERAPGCALHVGQMRAQHAKVAELLHTIEPRLAEWRRDGDPRTRDGLATAYDGLLDLLKLHLRREVVEVMPVAAKVITGEEWDAMAKASQGDIPFTRQLALLGYFIAGSPRELVAPMVAEMPMPLKLLYKLLGKRRFERQWRELFPGRPVPATM